MGKWGKCDFSQIKDFNEKLKRLQGNEYQLFCEDVAKELTARLLAKVIKRTPVGQYSGESGKMGGSLRRGWTGEKNSNATAYANSLPISRKGNMIEIEIVNPVHYASYVEYGHRTRNHQGWVKGRFMLTISEQELQNQAPAIIEKKLKNYLGDIFND